MAINFPDSPSNDDTHTVGSQTFVYKSSIPGWQRQVSGVNLSSVAQDILPDADSSRSLGSPTKKWKDLHLSGNTIFLGDSGSISASTGGEIILPSIKIGTGDNAVKLEADASGKLKTKSIVSGVTQAAEEPGNATVVTDMAGLIAVTGMSTGQTALVSALNKMFVYTGTGWFLIATVTNSSPTDITGVNAAYSLATDGTATTITAVSTDPEGFPLTWSYAVTTGSLGSTATVSQADNVFTITPSSTEADAGTFSITFSVTDGATGAVSVVSAFTLEFAAPASSVLFDVTGNYYEPTGAQSSAGEGTIFSWTVPTGVTSICVCCIGGGGGGSGNGHYSGTPYLWSGGGGFGGALAWMNDITVTPGEVLTLRVGWAAGQSVTGVYSGQTMYGRTGPIGGFSQLKRGSTEIMKAEGGLGGLFQSSTVQAAATYTVSSSHGSSRGGGNGGLGGKAQSGSGAFGGGGGGAGGYSGAGGNGAFSTWGASVSHGGSGGGGGGGGKNGVTSNPRNGGGGVGIYGEGSSGVAVAHYGTGQTGAGNGGSGGTNAIINHPFYGGGTYGGGGGSLSQNIGFNRPGAGGSGAIRIMWGAGRAYPSTNVDNSHNVDAETVV